MELVVVKMGVLLVILSTIGIGFISSSIAMFWQWCFKWNPWGQKWIVFLRLIKINIKGKKAKKRFQNLMKPLGYCVYCQSTWLAIFLSLFLLGWNPLYMIMSMGMNYYFLEKFNKFLNPKYY